MKLKLHSNKIIPIILAAGRGSRMGKLTTNKHKIIWRGVDTAGNEVGSGIYFCVVKSENSTHSKKIVMAK